MLTHNRYLVYIGIASLVSWFAFFLVITRLQPQHSQTISLLVFFISLFFALTTTFTIAGYFFRLWWHQNEIFYNHLNISLRQGILLSSIAISAIGLQILQILNWWIGILLITAITLIEIYITSISNKH